MKTNRVSAAIAILIFLAAIVPQCRAIDRLPLKILLANDDGIEAPGLMALFEALGQVGTVTVVTPAGDQSGVSHAMTTNKPIAVREIPRGNGKWYATDATPAASVRLALETLLPEKPDIVITGINRGENVGLVTYYSATVAAAREAAFLRIPALSVNLQRGENMDYRQAADLVVALVRELARRGFEKGLLLNVNVPNRPRDRIKGILITRQDVRPTAEFYERRESRDGLTFYWPSYKNLGPGPENTDTWAVANGYISITPLGLDQTDAAGLGALKSLEKLDWK
jgi:5'-nucleotidase